MPLMSNSRLPADAIAYRRAEPSELHEAIRLLLAGSNGGVTEEQMIDFIDASQQRGIDLADTWVAAHGSRVVFSLLPVVSPGKTMLVLSPPYAPPRRSFGDGDGSESVVELSNRVCDHAKLHDGVELAQMLIDPSEISLKQLYLRAGFIDLAELIYLQRAVRRLPAVDPLPGNAHVLTYDETLYPLFIETIRRSYTDSLDCPALNGLRNMDDVLAGHRNSGEFDPSIWFILLDSDRPLGVMLLSRSLRGDAIELVYLGLTPEARGQGWADRLLQLALVTVVRQNKTNLTLAVDSKNTPALKLYQRHGLARVGSRRALIRDLRS